MQTNCCEYHFRLSQVDELLNQSNTLVEEIAKLLFDVAMSEVSDREIDLRRIELNARIISRNSANASDKLLIMGYLTPCNDNGNTVLGEESIKQHWENVIAESILSGIGGEDGTESS